MRPALDPDPAVPQRDLLLDPPLVAGRLATLLRPKRPLAIEDCRQTRVKYRIGARLRVVHRIIVDSATFDVAASTFPTLERSERAFAKACAQAVPCGPLLPVAHDRELSIVFWTFPNDRKIARLPTVADPARRPAELLPAWSQSRVVAYAPEKTATLRCLDEHGRTVGYAKVHAGEEGERTYQVHAALAGALAPDDPDLRLPGSLGYSTADRTLVVAAIDGVPLTASPAPELAYRRLGRALARFHGLDPPDGARFHRLDPDRLEAAAELIGSVREDVARTAGELASQLADREGLDGPPVLLHGDVNFRNALGEDGRIALIDLDQVARGPAAAELGSVLASLRYAGIVGLLRPLLVPRLCEALLAGYGELRPLPAESALRRQTAAALLGERALRVVTRIRPAGLRRLPELLADARRLLA